MATSTTQLPALRRPSPRLARPQPKPSAETLSGARPARPNWPLLLLLAAIPLQNIYLAKLPTFGAGINFLNVMVLLAFASAKLRSDLSGRTPTSLRLPIYGYALMLIVSVIHLAQMGRLPTGAISDLKDQLIPLLLYFVVLASVRDRRAIRWVLIATLLPIPYMFRVFHAQLQNVAGWHYDDDMRLVSSTFMKLGSNEMAAFFAGYSVVIIALLIYTGRKHVKLALAALTALSLYCLMYSYSRGSWLSFIIGMLALGLFVSRKWTIALVLLGALFYNTMFTLLPTSVQERFQTIQVEEGEERDRSAQSRFVLWQLAMEQYRESPIIGIGNDEFQRRNELGKEPHNYFVEVLTEQGALGALFLLLIFIQAWRLSRRLAKTAQDPLYRGLGIGMFGCVTAFAVGNLFGDRFSHYALITYFWVYLALVQRALHLCDDGRERA